MLTRAQADELRTILGGALDIPGGGEPQVIEGILMEAIVNRILLKSDVFVDILTMTPTSKPKARKVNGGTKKRKAPAEVPSNVHP